MGDRSHSRDQEMNQRVNNRTCIMEWMIEISEQKMDKIKYKHIPIPLVGNVCCGLLSDCCI